MGKFDGLLLVSDFDDTLYDFHHRIPPRNLEALGRWIGQGGRFTVATGRAHRTFAPYVHLAPINAPVVLSNGSTIYDFQTETMLVQTLLDDRAPEDFQALMEAMPSLGLETYHGEDIYVYRPNAITDAHMKKVGTDYEVRDIPDMPAPWTKAIVQQEIDGLKKMGVDFECNMVIGKVLTIDELMGEYGYEAVFVGSGAGLPRFMGIPGESLKGVYSANEFLTRSNLMKAYLPTSKTPIRTGRKVAVVGGGNVAMDAARSALRLGAETVYIVYRRGMAELPARKEEVEHAEEEGIIFKTLCNPVEILPDENGFVKAITCIEMELGEPDASGRRRPIEKKGSEFTMDVDTVIMSLGTSPNPLIRSTTPGLETNKHGCIVTEGDEGKTSREGVYAGGDAVTGAATVIKAMGAGKAAAKAIDEYIQNK